MSLGKRKLQMNVTVTMTPDQRRARAQTTVGLGSISSTSIHEPSRNLTVEKTIEEIELANQAALDLLNDEMPHVAKTLMGQLDAICRLKDLVLDQQPVIQK